MRGPSLLRARVHLERWLPCDVDTAWRQFVDPSLRAAWLGEGTLDPVAGGAVDLRLRHVDDGIPRWVGSVVRCEPPHLLEIAWKGGPGDEERVLFEITPRRGGSELTVTCTRPKDGEGASFAAALVAPLGVLEERLALVSSPYPSSTAGVAALRAARPSGIASPVLAVGIALVLLVSGAALGLYATHSGPFAKSPTIPASCAGPGGSPVNEPSPNGGAAWSGLPGASCDPWSVNGVPVAFVAASTACPYCDASSWALVLALQNFSVQLPLTFVRSDPGDVYPLTPGVDLGTNASYASPYLVWVPDEGQDEQQITLPNAGSPGETYLGEFDSAGSIPFTLVGGLYFTSITLVPPTALQANGSALSPVEVEENLTHPGSSERAAVGSAQAYLEAYFWKADALAGIAPPPQVAANATVAALEASIS